MTTENETADQGQASNLQKQFTRKDKMVATVKSLLWVTQQMRELNQRIADNRRTDCSGADADALAMLGSFLSLVVLQGFAAEMALKTLYSKTPAMNPILSMICTSFFDCFIRTLVQRSIRSFG